MHPCASSQSKPVLRWLAPLALVLAVGGGGLVASTATADNKLPARTAEQLLVDLQRARVDGLSGTVVQRADLGLPAIPGAGGRDSSELTSLVSGTHTLRVRYAGPEKMRLAVFGTYGETDVIRNGADLWVWSSKDNAATHRTLSAEEQRPGAERAPTDLPKTPEEAAQQVLAALTPTTTVTTDSAVTVAGRAAYELVLDPNDDGSLVSQVRIALDGETKMPLRVQLYGSGDKLAFEVGYTSVSFTAPDAAEFAFNPPPGDEGDRGGEGSGQQPEHRGAEEGRRSGRAGQEPGPDRRQRMVDGGGDAGRAGDRFGQPAA